jgi:serine/threonine protein kinase
MINKSSLEIKLIDFGSALPLSKTTTSTADFFGTPDYFSPEIVEDRPFMLEKQEVWTLGVLLFQLLYKDLPFANGDEIRTTNIAEYLRRHNVANLDTSDANELLVALLKKDPAQRPNLAEVGYFKFMSVRPKGTVFRSRL